MGIKVSDSNLEKDLAEMGKIVWKGRGISMRPLIHTDSDLIVIERADKPIRKYDIALYRSRRPPKGGLKREYILHRVIDKEAGRYIILGDNCITPEYVPEEEVVGVMTGLIRSGREIKLEGCRYNMYMSLWVKPWRMRVILLKTRKNIRCTIKRAAMTILPDRVIESLRRHRKTGFKR